MSKMKFYCIEYIDEEGDSVIRHTFLTQEQKQILLDEFSERGTKASIYDLTCMQTDTLSNEIDTLGFSKDKENELG